MKKRIYISGKISGLPQQIAEEYFNTVDAKLQEIGYDTVNPITIAPYNPEWTWAQYMSVCLATIPFCDECFMLDNWQDSKGAKIEHDVCKAIGMKIHYPNEHTLF